MVHPKLVGGASSRTLAHAGAGSELLPLGLLTLRAMEQAAGGALWVRYDTVRAQ